MTICLFAIEKKKTAASQKKAEPSSSASQKKSEEPAPARKPEAKPAERKETKDAPKHLKAKPQKKASMKKAQKARTRVCVHFSSSALPVSNWTSSQYPTYGTLSLDRIMFVHYPFTLHCVYVYVVLFGLVLKIINVLINFVCFHISGNQGCAWYSCQEDTDFSEMAQTQVTEVAEKPQISTKICATQKQVRFFLISLLLS